MPTARFRQVCLDANDLDAVGRFWSDALALDWRRNPDHPGGDVAGDGLVGLRIEQVGERRTVKNRAHPDIYARSIDDLVALGARVVLPQGDDRRWTVMADVEGNDFCAFLRDPVPEQRLHGVVIDCTDSTGLAGWWGRMLGGEVTHDPRWGGTVEPGEGRPFTLDFSAVPEPKTGKNRMHLDVRADGVADLLAAGATLLREPHVSVSWHVLADPDGNEFCVFPVDAD